ncbi:hypothetical protein ACWGQ5_11225 [Streptomyces sp. NPDC055722]
MSEFLGGRLDIEGRWSRVGTFPPHWGAPPTQWDSPERRDWIVDNCQRDKASGRGLNPVQRRVWLEARREDPAVARERAATATRARLMREELAALLLPSWRRSGRR